MVESYIGFDKAFKYLFDNATEVSASALYSSGTNIGSITIDGQTLDFFIPSSGGSTVTYNEGLQSGTLVGTLTIDGVSHSLYCTEVEANPAGTATANLTKLGIGGTVYSITGSGGGSSHTYSTTEQIVGTWIDGSDIFETTFDVTNPVAIGVNWTGVQSIVIANIDRVISVQGFGDNLKYCFPLIGAHDAGYLECKSNTSNDNLVRYFTVQYTKSV